MPNEQTGPERVSLEQAMATAMNLHREGQLDVAEKIYRRILEAVPGYPDGMHFLGVLLHQRGRPDEALELIRNSISMAPATADWHNNLGNVLFEQGEAEDACAAYRRALELDGDLASAHLNMANLLFRSGEVLRAVEHYNHVLRLTPDNYNARRMVGISLSTLGHTEAAAEIYRRWMEDEPDNPVARHLYAACTGQGVPERAEDRLVEQLFDPFAEYFDEKLERLDYKAPQLVGEIVAREFEPPDGTLECLDAGCGTGLCGAFLRPYCRHLTGVDLSSGMLEKARPRDCYDELVKAELTRFLAACDEQFDLIVSADTLVYFGRLDEVFAASYSALRPGGLLVFTLEESTADDGGDIRLNHHGRYSHRKDYVLTTLHAVGFAETDLQPAVLRTEAGAPVAGLLVSVRRPAISLAS